MSDEENRHAKTLLQLHHEIEDLRLDRHVERGDRLVEHDHVGVEGEGPGDADALALAAGELVRVAGRRVRRQVDGLEHLAQPGDLFFGLMGENGIDGMEFAGVAREKGAAAIVPGLDKLEKLGEAGRIRNNGKRIAVTGSVGKTGTKELLSTAFGALGRTHASAASYNNHIGVPLTLARLPSSCSNS